MKILFLGDVVGRSGRDAVCRALPQLRQTHKIDVCVVNGENAAGGFGITPEIYHALRQAGADVVTTGNHVWDQQSAVPLLEREPNLLRACNYPPTAPGRGLIEIKLPDGRMAVVLHLMGQVFMPETLDNPFHAAEKALEPYRLGKTAQAILVDFHAEANSEKMAMGHFLDGRASLVIGTHTHVPTADCMILPGGTAYQTDTGMCGDYISVIGFEKDAPLQRFLHKRKVRMSPAMGEATLCGAIVTTEDRSGLATAIEPLQLGGCIGRAAAHAETG